MPFKDPVVQKEYDRQKYYKNRERILKQRKEYAAKHQEEISSRYKVWQKQNREKQNAYQRKWRKEIQSPESKSRYRERARLWRRKNTRKSLAKNLRYAKKHKQKYMAHMLVGAAVHCGFLIRPKECSKCGSGGRIQGHHPDYSKPLEVIWLCHSCHLLAHDSSFNPAGRTTQESEPRSESR